MRAPSAGRRRTLIAASCVVCAAGAAAATAAAPVRRSAQPQPRAQAQPQAPASGNDAQVPVRFAEGMVHGFLELHTQAGAFLASGDQFQIPRDGGIDSRMTFHFTDGSLFDETVRFTQHGTFALERYHLIQRGPAFTGDIDATLERSGAYTVKTKAHDTGKENVLSGSIPVPADTYDGLITTLAKNLAHGESRTVHDVAFTPKPVLIEIEITPLGETHVMNSRRSEVVTEYALKPRLGALKTTLAKVLGKMPPDGHAWMVTEGVPAFLRFEGPMYSGPVWRLDITTPKWER